MLGMRRGHIYKAGGMGLQAIYLYVTKEHATKDKSAETFR